jgi:hypothetical protein
MMKAEDREILRLVEADLKEAVVELLPLFERRVAQMNEQLCLIYESTKKKLEEKFWVKVNKVTARRLEIVEANIQAQRKRVKAAGLVYSDELVAEDCRARTQAMRQNSFKRYIEEAVLKMEKEKAQKIAAWSEFMQTTTTGFVKMMKEGGDRFLDELEFSLKMNKDFIERGQLKRAAFTNRLGFHLIDLSAQREQRVKEFHDNCEADFATIKGGIAQNMIDGIKFLVKMDWEIEESSVLSHCFFRPISSF